MSTKKRFGKGTKIGLGIGVAFFLILVIGAIAGPPNAGTSTNNQKSIVNTTPIEQTSSSNDSSSQQTITNSEIVIPREIPDAMKETLGDNIQVVVNQTKTGQFEVVAFVPPGQSFLVSLGSNYAFNTFQNIFNDNRFQDVSYVGIVFMDNFVDKYGNKSSNIGLEYGVSRSTAEKIKDWHHYMDYSSNDPVGWFRSIMDPTKDVIYVNPIELKG